jgi:zinc/manganese transport system substrate-binding protein
VVVSVDQWGDIVDRLAGDCGAVTTIFKSSSADPHDYEPTPADSAKFTGARLVVVNGLDYDPWADKAVATLDTKPVIVDAGRIVGRENGDNPHLWYGPSYVYKVADAVTAELTRLRPADATYFAQRHNAWRASMRPYDAEIAKIARRTPGRSYAATEGIFDYMAHAVGLANNTPRGYANATANESDPSPGDVNDIDRLLEHKEVDVLIYNTQTQGAIPEQVRRRARQAKVPVVNVTESVPPRVRTFAAWQVSQLKDLADALGA